MFGWMTAQVKLPAVVGVPCYSEDLDWVGILYAVMGTCGKTLVKLETLST